VYLAVILDLATRGKVAWAIRKRLDRELALSALRIALTHHGLKAGCIIRIAASSTRAPRINGA
jgi:transposase InsO family protein